MANWKTEDSALNDSKYGDHMKNNFVYQMRLIYKSLYLAKTNVYTILDFGGARPWM
jgi:hypothetical protein